MTSENSASRLLATTNVREFFQHSVLDSLQRQKVEVSEDTVVYIVDLLTRFTRSDRFYETCASGITLTPLAVTLGEAMQAQSPERRRLCLQRLGDVALFVSGLFADSLTRHAVDVDYYIAMGETAYGTLVDALEDSVRGRVFSGIYLELSSRFGRIVDVLADITDTGELSGSAEVLRAYEVYLRTGSDRAARRLRRAGIEVSRNLGSCAQH